MSLSKTDGIIYSERKEMTAMADELRHHGIKGQKWGVRRFQNEDGSLTPAGQKRRSGSESRKSLSDDDDSRIRKMSDEELRNRINRLNLEQQYKRLTKNPTKLSESVDRFNKYVGILSTVSTAIGAVIAIHSNAPKIASWFKKK